MNTYIRDLVRTRHYPHYILSFFAPRGRRDAVLTVFALDCELAAIPHLTTEPTMRLIRRQWWRDSLDNTATGQSPIIDTAKSHDIPSPLLHALIDAHGDENDIHVDHALDNAFKHILGNDYARFAKKRAHLLKLDAAGKSHHPLLPVRLLLGV